MKNFESLDLSLPKEKYKKVLKRYEEPHRVYHDRRHIDLLFEGLSEMHDALVVDGFTLHQIDMVKCAIVYHDAVYDIGSSSNEEDSATLLAKDCHANGWFNQTDIDMMTNAIMMTGPRYFHNTVSVKSVKVAHKIGSVVCDVDLYPFALEAKRFNEVADRVFEEYSGGNENFKIPFYLGNMKFLMNYLGRDNIYNTTYAQKNWHRPAVRNIMRRFAMMANYVADSV